MFEPIRLPEEVVNDILQYSQVIDDNFWALGDKANYIYYTLGGAYTYERCADTVAFHVKWKKETIRHQAWVCRKIPPSKREYGLSRHQYIACLAAGDKWEAYAKRAEEYADDHGGHSAHCEEIRRWIKGTPDEVPIWTKRLKSIVRTAKLVVKDEQAPEDVKDLLRGIAEYVNR